jgi:hypothetical protein
MAGSGTLASTVNTVLAILAFFWSYQFNFQRSSSDRILRALCAAFFALPYILLKTLVWSDEFDRMETLRKASLGQSPIIAVPSKPSTV